MAMTNLKRKRSAACEVKLFSNLVIKELSQNEVHVLGNGIPKELIH
jgi:hypothetical protein